MIIHILLLFSLQTAFGDDCTTNTYVSSRADVPDSWCQINCEAAIDYCLGTGFCHCSTDIETTTTTTQAPTEPVVTTSPDDTTEHVRLCYFTNWARYRADAGSQDVFAMGMDPTLCTHINYGFGTIDPNTFEPKAHDPWADHPMGVAAQTELCPSQCKPGYVHNWSDGANPCVSACDPNRELRGFEALTVGMKGKNPNLKAILSVGGWTFNDCQQEPIYGMGSNTCEIFSRIAESEENIRSHAASVIKFLRCWGFDGYDIDWEYPVVTGKNRVSGEPTPQDFDNYINMLRILREEFEKEAAETGQARLMLTAAVGVGFTTVEVAYNIPEMDKYLDLIGLMTYDFHGDWEEGNNFNSPLYSNADDLSYYDYDMSSSWAVDYWLSHGVSANKLLLGLATYGRGWKLQDPTCTETRCPTNGACAAGQYTQLPGYLAYFEIEAMVNSGQATKYWDDERKVPYVITTANDWIGYDDLESFEVKTDFIRSNGLRGAIVWAIDLDDIHNGYPMLNKLKDGLFDYTLEDGTTTTQIDDETTTRQIDETDDVTTTSTTEAATTTTATVVDEDAEDHVRLCYFTNWARYRPDANSQDVFAMGMDPTLCTHINYGFGTIDPATFHVKAHDPWADHPSGDGSQTELCDSICKPGYFHDWSTGENPCQYPCDPDRELRGFEGLTVGMKGKNPDLKAILSVGGWTFNDCAVPDTYGMGRSTCEIFSRIAESEDNIRTHAASVISFLRGWGFDGYDIDWEYPVVTGKNRVNGDPTPQDYDNYINMLRILREEFEKEAVETGRERLLLTTAVGVGFTTVEVAYNIPEMDKYLDLVGLMTYDFHGDWEEGTNFNSPLYSNADDLSYYDYDMSSSWAVDYWLSHGLSANKLLMGMATYGRGWKLTDPSCTGTRCPTNGACSAGPNTELPGYLAYFEIENMVNNGQATKHWDDERKVPYVVTSQNEWIGYDDIQSFEIKTDFIKANNLRGAIVWAIDLDDIHNGYPLLNTLRDGLSGTVSIATTENVIVDTTTTEEVIVDTTTTTEEVIVDTTTTEQVIVDGEDPVRLCYFTNWARYRPDSGSKDVFELGMDPTLCTHINYGFGTIDPNTFEPKAHDPWADHPNGDGTQTELCDSVCRPGYVHDWSNGAANPCEYPCNPDRQLRGFEGLTVGLKEQNPDLKAILSVGGWTFNDCNQEPTYGMGSSTCEIFSTIASSEENIRSHAANVISFLRGWGFDGYDIDWEYPVVAGHNRVSGEATPQDFDNYINMLRILREEFEKEAVETGRERLLLTAAVGVGFTTVEVAYNIPMMNEYLDLIGLMTYDFHGDWEEGNNFNSPLYSNADDLAYYDYDMSGSWAVDYWLSHGASADKLLLGLATYGRGWKLQDADSCTGTRCPTIGACAAGPYTDLPGYLAYFEIEDMVSRGSATKHWDDERKVPYVVTINNDWIGYDDLQSFEVKTDFIKANSLRGAIVWAIDLDDLHNDYPLLNQLKSGLSDYIVPLDLETTSTEEVALFDCNDNSTIYNCWGEAGITPADCTTIKKWYKKNGQNEPWEVSVEYLQQNWSINVDGMTLKKVKRSFIDFCFE